MNLERCDDRIVPALFDVGLMNPGSGSSGNAAATFSGSLSVNPSLPTAGMYSVRVEADSAAEALERALVGTISAQFNGETMNYAMGPGAVGTAASEHKPFLFEGGMLRLEDMASSANGSDWDYDDRYFYVSVAPASGGSTPPPTSPPPTSPPPTNPPPAANRPPTVADLSVSLHAGASTSLYPSTSDADGDTVTLTGFTQGAHGTVTASSMYGYGLTYTATSPTYTGIDSFAYTVSDGRGGTATGTATITLTNAPPTVADLSVSLHAGASTSLYPLTSDPDGDAVTVTGFTQGAHGTVTASSMYGYGLTYAATDPTFTGTDSFTYTVSDGHGGTATGTATISLTNAPPTASNLSATVYSGGSTSLYPYTSDSDGDTVTLTEFTQGAHGTVTLGMYGYGLIYTADNPTFTGTDSFTYTVGDGHGGTATGTATIRINSYSQTVEVAVEEGLAGENPVEETLADGWFVVRRTNAIGTLEVAYILSGTATAGLDYASPSGTATFLDGEFETWIQISAFDDATVEPDETVTVTLGAGAYAVGNPSAALQISDTKRPVDRDDISYPAAGGGTIGWKRKGVAWLSDNQSYITVDPNAKILGKDGKSASTQPIAAVAVHTSNDDYKDYNFVQFERVRAYSLVSDGNGGVTKAEITVAGFKLVEPNSKWEVTIDNKWILDNAKKGGVSILYPKIQEIRDKKAGGARYMMDSPTTALSIHNELKKLPTFVNSTILVESDYLVLVLKGKDVIGQATYGYTYKTGDLVQTSGNGAASVTAPAAATMTEFGAVLRKHQKDQKDIDWKFFPE